MGCTVVRRMRCRARPHGASEAKRRGRSRSRATQKGSAHFCTMHFAAVRSCGRSGARRDLPLRIRAPTVYVAVLPVCQRGFVGKRWTRVIVSLLHRAFPALLSLMRSDTSHVAGCPLCMEDMDVTDKNFRPCKCGYQICLFCYNKIKDNHNGACPACRHGRALCLGIQRVIVAPHSDLRFILLCTEHPTMRPMLSLSRQTLLSALLQIHRNLATRPSPPKRFVAINKALHLCSWRNLFPAILQDG